jgi:predicted RNA-binding Zn-ribbon protein involved in translation (DUF1610 family)
MCEEYRERKQSSANAHQDQEIEQIMTNKCRRCHQLGVAATDTSPPEQQEYHNKNHDTGTYCINCNSHIANHEQTKETECGNCGNQRIGTSKGLNVAICGSDKEGNAQKQYSRFQNMLQYSTAREARIMRRRRFDPPPSMRADLQRGVDRGEVAQDGGAEGCNGSNAHDGDQADEHAVFDEGRALLILGKTYDKVLR